VSASQPTPPESRDSSSRQPLFALVVIVLGAGALYLYSNSRSKLPESVAQFQKENEALRQQLTEYRDRMTELGAEELMNLEGRQVLQARLLEISATGTLAVRRADLFAAEAAAWERLTSGIERSEEGRRIAADSEAMVQFAALLGEGRPRPERAAELKDQLQTLLMPVEEALKAKNAVYTPAEDLDSQIKAIAQELDQGVLIYGNHNARLKSILAAVPAVASSGTPTLGTALAELEQRYAEEENRRVAEAIARVREEEGKKLAAQKADAERMIGEAKREAEREATERELRRIRDEQADAARKEQERIAARELQVAREGLLAEFERDLPQIRRYLAAFLAEGYGQPVRNGNFQVTAEKGPMSLSGSAPAAHFRKTPAG
jgi:hypothetical protein